LELSFGFYEVIFLLSFCLKTEECQLSFTTNDYRHQLLFREAFLLRCHMLKQLERLNT